MSQKGKFKGVSSNLLKSFLSKKAYLNEDLLNLIKKMALEVGRENFIKQQQAISNRIDQRENLKKLKQPSLVLCGKLDILTPPELSIEMSRLLPNSELVLLPEVGHLSSIEAKSDVTDAIIRLIKKVK